jgi:lipoprotein-anchoring transpeptidase ErfK/SrfK
MRRRTIIATAAVAAAGPLLAACQREGKVLWKAPSEMDRIGSPSLTITPVTDASDVSPREPVTVTAVNATLDSVALGIEGGASVAGELDAGRTTWRSSEPLAYGKSYRVTARGMGANGKPVEQTVVFKTVKPAATTSVNFQANSLTALHNGDEYGVAQVVIVRFGQTPADRQAALAAIKVTSEPAVEGRWYWVDSRTAHYRPENFWAKGTKVTASAQLYGVHLGKGVYGAQDKSVSFSIGASRIAIADNATHYMRILVDGEQVKNVPISMGKNGYVVTSDGSKVYFPTRSGTHVVMTREPTVRMTSASYGVIDPNDPNFYDETISLCCRISYSGEFVHSAPWSVWAQGKQNVSHGCINVGPDNAQWFFDNFRLGDPVIVQGTGRPQAIGDSAGAVWDVPWAQMIPAA